MVLDEADNRPITVNDLKVLLPEILSNHVCTQKAAIELHTTMFSEVRQTMAQTNLQLTNILTQQSTLERTLTEKINVEFNSLSKELAVNKNAAELRHQAITDLLRDLTGRVYDVEETTANQGLKIQDLETRFEHIEDTSSKSIEDLQLTLEKLEAIMSPETIRFITDIKKEYETNRNRWVTIVAIGTGLTLILTAAFYFHNILVGGQKIIDYFRDEAKKVSEKKPEVEPKALPVK